MRQKVLFLILVLAGAMLVCPNSIRVVYPNGGETLYTNTQVTISWLTAEAKGKVVIVLYYQGVKYFTISSGAENTGRYAWRIPKDFRTGEKWRIRIRLLDNLAVNDFSDRDFKIVKQK